MHNVISVIGASVYDGIVPIAILANFYFLSLLILADIML